VTPVGLTSSTTPVQGRVIAENLGPSEGSDGCFSVMSLFSIGRPDIDQAIQEAVGKKKGDALINVRIYEKTIFMLLVTYTEVIVRGDVIRFAKEEVKKR